MKVGKFLVGLSIGVACGLLFAPKSGNELRKDIKDRSKKAYDDLKNMSKEDLEAKIGETIETVKKSVDEFDADEFKDSTKQRLNDLQTKLEELAAVVRETDEYQQVKESVVDITDKVNTKMAEVKEKVDDATLDDEYLDDLEEEIKDVEDKLDEMIDDIEE
ncbi:MAG: YtxH domain-containing protein [Erysipelotrichaceae bacterium]|nr:YtxH domain-containing protein [Erysipelotrichaceae bacterium]